jgi:iron complex outermembrane receptor protein
MEKIFFKRWTNKAYAVLSSFHKEIQIGTLALSCILLQLQPVLSQADTASPMMFYDLEEVESLSEDEADIYAPQLRQLLLIKQEQLDLVSSRSIADILNYYPGIDIRTRGPKGIQSDLNIQGGSFDQSLVLLNGIDVSDPQTGHFNLDLPVDLGQIQKLEIMKGPASKKYGLAAYSGAINLITKPSDSLGVKAEFAYGQFNTIHGNGTIQLPFKAIRTMISASYNESEGYRENTDYASSSLYMHSRAEKERFNTDLILGWNQKSFGANSFYTPRFPDQFEETSSLLSILKFETNKSKLKTDANIYWKRHYDHFLLFRDNPAAYENYHLSDVLGASVGSRLSTTIGISSIHLKYRQEQIYSTTLGETLEAPIAIKNVSGSYYSKFKSRNHLSLSAEHLAELGKFYINTGFLVQATDNSQSLPGLYPGIDISYNPGNSFSLFLSANRSLRLPTFTDLYYQGPQNRGNPELLPETASTYESGARFKGDFLQGEIAFFYRNGKETIDWIWEDSLWQTRNLTNLNTYGGETSLTILPSEISHRMRMIEYVRLSYSYVEINKAADSFISNYVLDNLKHKLLFDINFQLPAGIYINAVAIWQDRNGFYLHYESPTALPYDAPYDDYWLVDINAGIKLNKLTIYMQASNLFDIKYRDIGSVIMPGRWIMAGIKIRQ